MRDDKVLQEQPDQAALTERYTSECVQFIREHRETPFFLYLAHMYVHAPIYAPQRFLRDSGNGRYGAAVECVDWSTGVLLHELEQLGWREDTLVVFTSDHGSRAHSGASNAPLRGAKGTTWEGGQRVPWLVSWPGAIAPGQVGADLVTSMDLMPTFVEFTGGSTSGGAAIDGLSLAPLLTGPPGIASPREEFGYFHRDSLQAVRVGRWKLHLGLSEEQVGLFDVVADPGETHDLRGEHPEVLPVLHEAARLLRADLGDLGLGIAGSECRSIGRTEGPRPLTTYDPEHPYLIAEYDLADRG